MEEVKTLRYIVRDGEKVLQMKVHYQDPVGYVNSKGVREYWQSEEWIDVPNIGEVPNDEVSKL